MMLTWQSVLRRPRAAPPLLMAHRGASDELPENSLPAFQRALEQGADALETDIRFTRDDEIILMHDRTVDRTTNGTGTVAEMTLSEIKQLRTRRPADERAKGAPPPTLAEFVEFARNANVPLALELKDDRFIERKGAEQLVDLLARQNVINRVVLLSFSSQRIHACRTVAPQIPIGKITLRNPLPLYDTELMGPFYPLLYLNPLYIAWAWRRGKIASPLDPAPEPRLAFYRRLGVPALLTNHPAVTRNAVGKVWK